MLETAQDKTLDKAITKLKYFSKDEQLRFDAISREKFINDRASLERSAKLAGKAEGEKEKKLRSSLTSKRWAYLKNR